ncbi:MAG: tryptophan-rich sensory protein [Clostridiales bacterium]|nr:tryptophan-rich sensory protein [Clostridiales bacterium]
MNKRNWKPYLFFILLAEGAGALSAFLSMGGMELYNQAVIKPALTPPAAAFPIVWGILYALMGIGAARVYLAPRSKERTVALWLFFAQLVVNFAWSPIFFQLQAFGFAFFWLLLLWALVLAMTIAFYRVDPLSGLLQIPYLIWLTIAAVLNLSVWRLNR